MFTQPAGVGQEGIEVDDVLYHGHCEGTRLLELLANHFLAGNFGSVSMGSFGQQPIALHLPCWKSWYRIVLFCMILASGLPFDLGSTLEQRLRLRWRGHSPGILKLPPPNAHLGPA